MDPLITTQCISMKWLCSVHMDHSLPHLCLWFFFLSFPSTYATFFLLDLSHLLAETLSVVYSLFSRIEVIPPPLFI